MKDVLKDLAKQIQEGLSRSGLKCASDWAEKYIVIGEDRMNFDEYPWSRTIIDCEEDFVCIKGSQTGLTTLALARSLMKIDLDGESVIYILPTIAVAGKFSDSKFDPMIEDSGHISKMFSNVNSKSIKTSGPVSLFILGSKSRSDLKGIVGSTVFIDEFDECEQGVEVLARERMASFLIKQLGIFSTPTFPNYGVDRLYKDSTQEVFEFICPHCNTWTTLDFDEGGFSCHVNGIKIPEELDADGKQVSGDYTRHGNLMVCGDDVTSREIFKSHYITTCCDHKLTLDDKLAVYKDISKTRFTATYPDRILRGFNVPQLYSPTVEAFTVAQNYLGALGDSFKLREFFNHQLGKVYLDKNSTVTDEDFISCVKKYAMQDTGIPNTLITVGVDIGTVIHYCVTSYTIDKLGANIIKNANAKIIKMGTVDKFEDIDKIMLKFNANYCVVDASPEKRKSWELCERHQGRCRMCFYVQGQKSAKDTQAPEEDYKVSVDRTSWLDLCFERFRNGTVQVPTGHPQEFSDHLKALVKVYDEDKEGNPIALYKKIRKDDHYAHAFLYSNLAFALCASVSLNKNLADIL